MNGNNWAYSEFNHISISDDRIVNRLIYTTEKLSLYPHLSIPQALGDWKDTKAAYRMIDNDKLTSEAMIMSHKSETINRMKKYETILSVQDTTYLDYSNHPNIEGLGLYSVSDKKKGILLHSTLAVTTAGVPLGLLNQEIWTRLPQDYDRDYSKLPIEEKESYKWLKSLEYSMEGIPDDINVVTVCDREADIYEFFLKASSEGHNLLVRVDKDRRVLGEHKSLVKHVTNQPAAGEIIVRVPRNAKLNYPEREARLRIKFSPVTIMPPTKYPASMPKLELYAVVAEEVSAPPKGVKSIFWVLLTTLPLTNMEQVVEKIQWYTHRWKIERFHLPL